MVFSQNPYPAILTPSQCDSVGAGASRKSLPHEGTALMNGIRGSSPRLSVLRGDTRTSQQPANGKRAFIRLTVLELPTARTMRNKLLFRG